MRLKLQSYRVPLDFLRRLVGHLDRVELNAHIAVFVRLRVRNRAACVATKVKPPELWGCTSKGGIQTQSIKAIFYAPISGFEKTQRGAELVLDGERNGKCHLNASWFRFEVSKRRACRFALWIVRRPRRATRNVPAGGMLRCL